MSHDDFHVEPVHGLPEALPPDEHILWQGAPDPWRLACAALNLRWVAGYFALLALWRVGASDADATLGAALLHGLPFVAAGVFVCAVLYGIAAMQARATVYTLTNKRVALRIGAALTLTLNLPYTWIGAARLDLNSKGHGTLAFELLGDSRVSYLMAWPHVRPWHFSKPQPALRCIPDAKRVARIFADAAETRIAQPVITRAAPASALAAE